MIRQAVILAGGFGRRLGALTASTPKPALLVGGKPFVQWLIEDLRRQGVDEVLLLAGFQAERLRDAIPADLRPELVVEPDPRGTGGALRHALDRLDDDFLLLNGDSVFAVDLADLAHAHGADADATLALRPLPDVSRYGAVELEGERIVRFAERPDRPGPGLINGGVGVLTRRLVDRVPDGREVSLEREIYPALAREGRLRGRPYDAPFIDIGVPKDFARAQTLAPEIFARS